MPLLRLLVLVFVGLPALAWAQDNTIVCYDVHTKQTTILPAVPVPPGRLHTAHSFGALSGLATLPQTAPRTDLVAGTQFTNRHRAAASFNLLDYPVRTAVELVGYQQGQRRPFCTGTLVGERFVLTGAHCVSSYITRQWFTGLDSMQVVPAYDNGRDAVLSSAAVDRIYVFKSWLNGKFDDLALLELTEPIGQTSGWVGLGAYSVLADYQGPVWHKFSYPAGDDMVQPPRYNGDTLYYEYGLATADSAWVYVPNHRDGAPGMSGGAILTTDNRTYWEAHGTFVYPYELRHCRIWPHQLAAFARVLAQPGPSLPQSACLAQIQVFPNPVADQLTVLPQSNSCLPLTIRLYDVLGRLLLTRRRQQVDALTIDLGFLHPGVYWLQLEAEGQRDTRRLVKIE